MKLYIKSNSNLGYLYIFKHGVGPGTLPEDVHIVKIKDLPRGYTAVWTDRFLTTSEMDEFDIPYETEINRYLDRIGYCQKNYDVVPCEDVDVCDNVTASDICYRDRDNDDRVVALDAGMSDEDVEKMLAEHPSYYRSTLDRFEACDNITASEYRYSAGRIEDDGTEDFYYDTGFDSWDEACDWGINHECTHIYDREKDAFLPIESCDTKYFANMVSASDNSNYFKYKVCGYYDADKRGLAESEDVDDTQLVNAWANEYANKGYYITIEDRESGSIMEFSPDEWFEYWYMV